jgi:hypothetical protein
MNVLRLTVICVCVWAMMNAVVVGVNCNCCCKQVDAYGYDREGDLGTICYGYDHGSALPGIAVDSGTCLHTAQEQDLQAAYYIWYDCELACVGRLPAGLEDPNPSQEVFGGPGENTEFVGLRTVYYCVNPGPSDPEPVTTCD